VTHDLTGLPPTPAENEAIASNASPAAYERLVDRLLASPRYGEHRAHYWLDYVRYADQFGVNRYQVVLPAHLQAVPCVEEQADLSAGESLCEITDEAVHGGLIEVAPFKHGKVQLLELRGYVGGIIPGILQTWSFLVLRVADDQRHALVLRHCGRRQR
jgi:hypothetical protein